MTVSFDLTDRAAIVTGGGSGIGAAIATSLADFGAAVGCVDRDHAAAQVTADAIAAAGGRALALRADVTDEDQMAACVASVEAELGPLRIAVNSAGVAGGQPSTDMTLDEWRRVVDVNLTGTFISCRAQGRAMLEHGAGSIVNIASISATIANRGLTQAHYNASKAGVVHLSRSLALEWADRGVRVNAISPGYTLTPMNERAEVADLVTAWTHDTPIGRLARPDEMAGPAVFLASDASSYVTGIDLVVDGGAVGW